MKEDTQEGLIKITTGKNIFWIVMAITALIAIPVLKSSYANWQQSMRGKHVTTVSPTNPRLLIEPGFGTHIIKISSDENWTNAAGILSTDASKHVEATMITPGVWWQSMRNADTNTMYDMYPSGYKSNRFDTGKFTIKQWRIRPVPNQGRSEAIIVCKVTRR